MSEDVESAPNDAPAHGKAVELTKRIIRGTQKIHHDLFKLGVAKMLKNISYEDDSPELVKVEHVHFFHSVDSYGKPLNESTTIGGHFHPLEIIQNPGGIPTVICGPAQRRVRKKIGKKEVAVVQDIEFSDADHPIDDHTHEMIYLGSQEINMREVNVEAAQVEAMVQTKMSPSAPAGMGEIAMKNGKLAAEEAVE